jgi:tetratricopeptide (TPR) repeat protein
MNGSDAIKLDRVLGVTERGVLWSAMRRQPGDRIVRIIDPRFCDFDFRHTLSDLRAKPYSRTLPIINDGFIGERFFIEYATDSRWETLEAHFARKHWRVRLAAIKQICQVLPQWSLAPVHPLGLHARNIIMVETANMWFPWLLLCPPFNYTSPHDLFGVDSFVLSSLAPEIIRDVESDVRSLDYYALGNLSLRALAVRETQPATTDDELLEAQACGTLIAPDLKTSDVEEFLHDHAAVRRFQLALRHYTQVAPDARPHNVTELETACEELLTATEPMNLAGERLQHGKSREALSVLSWGWKNFGDDLDERLLAAEICERLEDMPQALGHLDRAIEILDGMGLASIEIYETRTQLCLKRCELRWELYRNLPALTNGETDAEGDRLLKDLTWIRENGGGGVGFDRNTTQMRAAFVYRRRHDLIEAAREFYEAVELEPSDMRALYSYGECLRGLGDTNGTAQLIEEARRRINKMVNVELMDKAEAELWLEKFDSLSQA